METKLVGIMVIALGLTIYALGIVVSLLLFMERRKEFGKGETPEPAVSKFRERVCSTLIVGGSILIAAGIKFF